MKSSLLKVGDRVATYGNPLEGRLALFLGRQVLCQRELGTITKVVTHQPLLIFVIKLDRGKNNLCWYAKQCRKLKKKEQECVYLSPNGEQCLRSQGFTAALITSTKSKLNYIKYAKVGK